MKRWRHVLTLDGLRRTARAALPGGRSEENRAAGFRPAFMDVDTGRVYPSRFRDGRPAPCHVLDGLPAELVVQRSASGRVLAVKGSVLSGFLRSGRFYTRGEAAARRLAR